MTAPAGDALSHAQFGRASRCFQNLRRIRFLASDTGPPLRVGQRKRTSFHALNAWRHEQSEGTADAPKPFHVRIT
jgi:hypothetical protein